MVEESPAPSPRPREHGPPSLIELTVEAMARDIEQVPELVGIPEELAVVLFNKVLKRGKLSPKVLGKFEQTRHEAMADLFKALNLQPVPPVLPTHCHGTAPKWL